MPPTRTIPTTLSSVRRELSSIFASTRPMHAATSAAHRSGAPPNIIPTAIPRSDAWDTPSAMNPSFLGTMKTPNRPSRTASRREPISARCINGVVSISDIKSM